jgi:ribosome-associated translation inhibitor RaiA
MKHPVQVSFHNVPPSPAAEEQIRECVSWLGRVYDPIRACRVVVDTPHRRHRQGKKFRVTIEIAVPGRTLRASRDSGLDDSHDDVYAAIRDSFDAARRRLGDYARRQRRNVKKHAGMPYV